MTLILSLSFTWILPLCKYSPEYIIRVPFQDKELFAIYIMHGDHIHKRCYQGNKKSIKEHFYQRSSWEHNNPGHVGNNLNGIVTVCCTVAGTRYPRIEYKGVRVCLRVCECVSGSVLKNKYCDTELVLVYQNDWNSGHRLNEDNMK